MYPTRAAKPHIHLLRCVPLPYPLDTNATDAEYTMYIHLIRSPQAEPPRLRQQTTFYWGCTVAKPPDTKGSCRDERGGGNGGDKGILPNHILGEPALSITSTTPGRSASMFARIPTSPVAAERLTCTTLGGEYRLQRIGTMDSSAGE